MYCTTIVNSTLTVRKVQQLQKRSYRPRGGGGGRGVEGGTYIWEWLTCSSSMPKLGVFWWHFTQKIGGLWPGEADCEFQTIMADSNLTGPFLALSVSNRPWATQNQVAHVAIAKTPQWPVQFCVFHWQCKKKEQSHKNRVIYRKNTHFVQNYGYIFSQFWHICDMIKGNESDVGNIDFELQA